MENLELNFNLSIRECSEVEGSLKVDDEQLSPILCLPDEITIKIFSYIPQKDLVQSISKVCQFWSDIVYDCSLWTQLNLDLLGIMSSVKLCKFLKKLPGLQRLLKLSNIEDLSDGTIAIVTELVPELVELDFSFCDLHEFFALDAIVRNCPKLEKLNLEGCSCKINDKFIVMLCKAKKLKHLNLSHCILTDNQLIYLSHHLGEIRSLDINGVLYISDGSVEVLLNTHYKYLQELALDGEDLSDLTVELLSRCPQLYKLQIFFCELLTDTSLHYLQKLNKLKHLTLRKGPGFTSDAFLSFFQNCDLSDLQYLDIAECPDLSDESIICFCQKYGRGIKKLDLSWCWHLSDKSLVSIVDHCGVLEELRLVGVDIKGDCLDNVPQIMPKLIFCDFEKCSFVSLVLCQFTKRGGEGIGGASFFFRTFNCCTVVI